MDVPTVSQAESVPPKGFRGRFSDTARVCAAYSEGAGPYRIVPHAVAVPRDTRDLVLLVRAASEIGTPLIARGAGSGMPGGNIGFGIVVDLQSLDRTVSIVGRRAMVGASALWRDLDRAAAAHNLRLPPDPSSGAFCTLGGMIATNAAGPRSLRFGSIRRWVEGLEVVTADGDIAWLTRATASTQPLRCPGGPSAVERFQRAAAPAILASADLIQARFPSTTKNSAGYALDEYERTRDVLDLIIGSEGTLGFVTRAQLALDSRPAASAVMLVALDELAALADTVSSLRATGPVAIELIDRTLLRLGGDRVPRRLHGVEAILLVVFEGPDDATVRHLMDDAAQTVGLDPNSVEMAVTEADQAALWALRKAASPTLAGLPDSRRSLQFVEDGCVPLAALGHYLQGVRNAAAAAGIEIVAFGHAGDGHLHVNALADTKDPDLSRRLASLFDGVSELVIRLGGTPSGEHGDGRLRTGLLERLYGREVVALFQKVKVAFDQNGILNPGVILSNGVSDPTRHLKVGPTATPIPVDIAAALRDLEQTGSWQLSKLELSAERK